jgi:hypothetical protein
MSDRPPGSGEPPLTTQQRTALERLITRLVALTSQQNAEVWACVKHDLSLKNDAPLLASHFAAAEHSLNQRLILAQQNHHRRQILAQLSELLNQATIARRSAIIFVSMTVKPPCMPCPSRSWRMFCSSCKAASSRFLSRSSAANASSAAARGAQHAQSAGDQTRRGHRRVQQAYLAIHAGAKRRQERRADPGDPLHSLSYWLHARQTLSSQAAPTLTSLQAALKQPLEAAEWQRVMDFAQTHWHATAQTPLSAAQLLTLLNKIFVLRVARAGDAGDPAGSGASRLTVAGIEKTVGYRAGSYRGACPAVAGDLRRYHRPACGPNEYATYAATPANQDPQHGAYCRARKTEE